MTNTIAEHRSMARGRIGGSASLARYHCSVEGEEAAQDAAHRDYETAVVATTVPDVERWVQRVLEHPDITAVLLDTHGTRERQEFPTIGIRTRRRITKVVRDAVGRGGAVTAEVIISSLVHRLRLRVLVRHEPRCAEGRAGSASVQGTDAP